MSTDLFAKEESAAHGRSVLVAHLVQGLAEHGRATEEDTTVGVGMFVRDGLEDAVPLLLSS